MFYIFIGYNPTSVNNSRVQTIAGEKKKKKTAKKLQEYLKNYAICENVKFRAISWKFDILSITA